MIILKRINTYRNIFPYKFVEKESKENLTKIETEVGDYLLKNGFVKDKNNAFVYKKEDNISVVINKENHITLSITDFSNIDEKNLYEKICRFEKLLQDKFIFSFSSKFGYLAPNPIYIPYCTDIEYVLNLWAMNEKKFFSQVIKNIEIISGNRFYKEQISSIITLKFIPKYNEPIDTFFAYVNSVINSIVNEESKNFEELKKQNKILLLDKINKTLSIAKDPILINHYEGVNIISTVIYLAKEKHYKIIKQSFETLQKLNTSSDTKSLRSNARMIKKLLNKFENISNYVKII